MGKAVDFLEYFHIEAFDGLCPFIGEFVVRDCAFTIVLAFAAFLDVVTTWMLPCTKTNASADEIDHWDMYIYVMKEQAKRNRILIERLDDVMKLAELW
jgi:hypothetical protein